MKIFFKIIFLTALCTYALSEKNITTIAIVNNSIITNIDLQNEINFITLFEKIENKDIKKIALQTIVNDILKLQEITDNKIEVDAKFIDTKYYNLLNKIEQNNKNITENIKDKIYSKIKIETAWGILINQKYRWKISVNINEIENKIKEKKISVEDSKKFLEEKEKLIIEEKNKKIQIYSQNHLNNLKNTSSIKIFQ